MNKSGRIVRFREMGLEDQNALRLSRQEVQKLARLVDVIEQPAAEGHIKLAIIPDIPHVIADEFEIRQFDFRLDVAARLDVGFADIETQCLPAQARKFNGVTTFETA